MHVKAFKLPDKNPLFYPKNRMFEEYYTGYRRSTMPIPYPCVIRHGSTHEAAGTAIWPDPQIGTDLITMLILEAMSQNNC